MTKFPILVCLFWCPVKFVDCFFARFAKDDNVNTRSHLDITLTGTIDALSVYISTKGYPSLEEFFGTDYDGLQTMFDNVYKLGTKVADTQSKRKKKTYMHCNGDQIELAHNFVKSCQKRLKARTNNMKALRKQLGRCLYTLQAFYSNTNWVEMYGAQVYENFGVSNLMSVVTPDEDTCKDMDSKRYGCENNIIIHDKLLSGYHSKRGCVKPSKPLGSSTGKCSHGGKKDKSKSEIAKCGINKDSITEKWSPHYHLHEAAATAAIEATKRFLINNDTGILYTLGEDVFDNLFSIKQQQQRSLAFAVDYTGSMGNDITKVKEQMTELVTGSKSSPNAPADYILALFNDPDELTVGNKYSNGFEMIQAIGNISVEGGGDCPEYAASGLLQAIQLSRTGSTVILFTDASAKDASRVDEVIDAAVAKDIAITALLTGFCSRRKRRSVSERVRRSFDSFFEEIANATGGEVHHTNTADLGTVLDDVLEELFPSTEVIIDSYVWSSSSTSTMSIPVDSTMSLLKISINGSLSETDADIVYPNGTVESFTSSSANRLYTSSAETIISLQNPTSAILSLRRNVNNNWAVNITAQSTLEAVGELLQYDEDEDLESLSGSPIIGQNYSISWTVYNLNNGTCDYLHVVDAFGIIISSYAPSTRDTEFNKICSADIDIPEQNFKLKLEGTETSGLNFTRKFYTLYQPAFVVLSVTDLDDDVVLNNEQAIYYEVASQGDSTETYDVSITDSHGFILPPASVRHVIDSGETVNGSFIIKPTTASVIVSYTVQVTHSSSSQVQQVVTETIAVTDVERPSCSVLSSSGTCGSASLNTANCSSYIWRSTCEVTFSGTQLSSVSSTGGSAVTLDHVNITGLSSGPLLINITGSCCFPAVDVNIIDIDGYIAQCSLDFSDGSSVQSVESSTTTDPLDVALPIVGIIAGTVCSVVAVAATVIIARLYYYHKIKKPKISDSTLTLPRNEVTSRTAWGNMADIGGKTDIPRRPIFDPGSLTGFSKALPPPNT